MKLTTGQEEFFSSRADHLASELEKLLSPRLSMRMMMMIMTMMMMVVVAVTMVIM